MFRHSSIPLAVCLATAVVVTALPLAAQVPAPYPPDPTQYPPGQYPNQYPPGPYPPNQYPPNEYPARLPGGVPIGIPIPEIKLPKRKPKDEKKGEGGPRSAREMPVAAWNGIDGTLRKLGEKDLLLETKEKGILQFRVLAKTRFVDSSGEPVRDSLLKPGDRMRIEVSADDEETALRVTLLKKGTPAERTDAEKPVDQARVKPPENLPRSASPPPPPPESAAPGSASDARPSPPGEPAALDSEVVEARDAAATFSATLPNYVVQQVTTRYVSYTQPPSWSVMDVVGAEVAYIDGKEDYRNVTINGRPVRRPVEQTGSWTTGEFGTTLDDILAPATNAAFKRLGEQTIGNRMVVVYEFSVKQPNSHWTIVGEGQRYSPAYTGMLYIERLSHRVLRIEQFTQAMPSSFPFEKAESIVDYDFVRIDQGSHLLPSHAGNMICKRGPGVCTRNEIEFRNYKKFTSESQIKF